jgi:hypothetical protein
VIYRALIGLTGRVALENAGPFVPTYVMRLGIGSTELEISYLILLNNYKVFLIKNIIL